VVPVSISTSVLKNKSGKNIGGVETFRDLSSFEELKKEMKCTYTFEDIISKNHRIKEITDVLPTIAESNSTVLIQGPSGSGKELFARAIHNLSLRNRGPFIAINCGALPDNLLESELFGYRKGAFTGAIKDKPGRFTMATGGTIFLDEVESLSPAMQVKLLRVLQEKEYEPLGATNSVKSDVRVLSATKEDLSQLVQKDIFRDDLYYRLNVVKILLPSLKERREDIPLLIDHFIEKFNLKMGRMIEKLSEKALGLLMNYDFPGNVRELENIMEHAFVMCQGDVIKLSHIPPEILNQKNEYQQVKMDISPLENAERKILLQTLETHNYNKIATAKALDMHRATLYRKMKKYGLM
jgi:transcriptional regulator with PAS, ATPase and Fis domain